MLFFGNFYPVNNNSLHHGGHFVSLRSNVNPAANKYLAPFTMHVKIIKHYHVYLDAITFFTFIVIYSCFLYELNMYLMILADLSHQCTFVSDVKRAAQSNIVAPRSDYDSSVE